MHALQGAMPALMANVCALEALVHAPGVAMHTSTIVVYAPQATVQTPKEVMRIPQATICAPIMPCTPQSLQSLHLAIQRGSNVVAIVDKITLVLPC